MYKKHGGMMMKTYVVKSVDIISGLIVLTIEGNGDGLKKDVKISDENQNVFMIHSIAMSGRGKTLNDETLLTVKRVTENNEIGKILHIVSIKGNRNYKNFKKIRKNT